MPADGDQRSAARREAQLRRVLALHLRRHEEVAVGHDAAQAAPLDDRDDAAVVVPHRLGGGRRGVLGAAGRHVARHQVGGFLGVWLGGVFFERTGSYDMVWWLAILLGLLSAVINLPIVEKPVARPAAAPA